MTKPSLSIISTFDYVWNRLNARITGLDDDEYLWEPVPECWSLRPTSSGGWLLDGDGGGGPAPTPTRITTIAWRICHLAGLAVGGFASMRFGDGSLTTTTLELPANASDVTRFLDTHYKAWRNGLASLDEQAWEAPLGPAFGPFADSNTVDLALHVLDEVIHHSAEIGLLRDLYPLRAEIGNS